MFLVGADPLRAQLGGDWALEIETFWGPEMANRVPFGPKKVGKKNLLHCAHSDAVNFSYSTAPLPPSHISIPP